MLIFLRISLLSNAYLSYSSNDWIWSSNYSLISAYSSTIASLFLAAIIVIEDFRGELDSLFEIKDLLGGLTAIYLLGFPRLPDLSWMTVFDF